MLAAYPPGGEHPGLVPEGRRSVVAIKAPSKVLPASGTLTPSSGLALETQGCSGAGRRTIGRR